MTCCYGYVNRGPIFKIEMAIMPLISASMTSSPNFLTWSFCHSFSILNSLLERRVLWACALFDLNPLQRFHPHLQRMFFAKIGRAKFRKASCRVFCPLTAFKSLYPLSFWPIVLTPASFNLCSTSSRWLALRKLLVLFSLGILCSFLSSSLFFFFLVFTFLSPSFTSLIFHLLVPSSGPASMYCQNLGLHNIKLSHNDHE